MKRFLSGIFGKPAGENGALKPEEFFNEFVAAFKSRDQEKIRQLVARNMGRINARNKDGVSVLSVAAAGGSREAVELLLKAGAYVDSQDNMGLTALMLAVTNGHRDVVEYLINAGAGIDIYNKFDGTALTIARSAEYPDIEELLKKRSGL